MLEELVIAETALIHVIALLDQRQQDLVTLERDRVLQGRAILEQDLAALELILLAQDLKRKHLDLLATLEVKLEAALRLLDQADLQDLDQVDHHLDAVENKIKHKLL